MRRLIILTCFIILLFAGCVSRNNSGATNDSGSGKNTNKNQSLILEGIVKKVNLKDGKITSILVLDDKNTEYVFYIDEKVDFKDEKNLKTGNTVKIEHSGQFRESYPMQGTALKINILQGKVSEIVDEKSYSIIPIKTQYNETLYQKITNSLGVYSDVIDNKDEFDSYINELNFDSEYKINLKQKYDSTFFEAKRLVTIVKFTSSTPTYSINSLTKGNGKLNVVIEEKSSEMQTTDITIKGFLIEIDNNIMKDITDLNIEYIEEIITK